MPDLSDAARGRRGLDTLMALRHENGIDLVLATPTFPPPPSPRTSPPATASGLNFNTNNLTGKRG